ncbi:MAG: putative Ig domain-containing protein, partial [Synergistaceae bacterium]|nr:putative Ig domain-containing protein [Synergistaceae bacterium]
LSLSISPADNPEAPIISTLSLPVGTVSRDYEAVITAVASGDKSNMTWTVTYSGSIPEGIDIPSYYVGESLTISGTPTEASTFTFMVQVSLNGYSDRQSFTLTINTIAPPVIISSSLPYGTKDTPYSATLTASGTPPIEWSVESGKFPDGLNIAGSTGVISGTPTVAGNFSFNILAKNDGGETSKDFLIVINAPKVVPSPEEDVDESDKKEEEKKSEEKKEKAVFGLSRSVSSLSSGELATVSNDEMMIAAILPEITVNVSDIYDFNDIRIDSRVPNGAVMVWNSFARISGSEAELSNANDNSGVQFMDKNGKEISTVPEEHVIDVSVYLEGGYTYGPVISAYVSSDNEAVGTTSGSGGCIAGFSGVILFALLGLPLYRKK